MAKYDYPKYKVLIDPHSKKVQGLKMGDVVRREYYDAPDLIYSLMVVLETGSELIGDADSAYFIGALIEGDAPKAGELLDFVRVTNLFDEERGGALYLTASDSDAPYMDVIDSLAKDHSISWPVMGGVDNGGTVSNPDKYGCRTASSFDDVYKESDGEVSRVYRITSKKTFYNYDIRYGVKVNLDAGFEVSQRILISFKARASKEFEGVPVSFGYSVSNGIFDYDDTVSIGTQWRYYLSVFNIDYNGTINRAFFLTPSGQMKTIGDWVEIADLCIISQSDVAEFSKASKTRVGKIQGVIDPVFGVLDGYGAYFQNLYATRNVNIAGTLTAGDENGFASTFYVGKIHKNVILNSFEPSFVGAVPATANELPPASIGKSWQVGGSVMLEVQSAEWNGLHIDQEYCFSFWVKSSADTTLSLFQNDYHFKDIQITATGDWRRYHGSFRIQDSEGQPTIIRIESTTEGAVMSSPQLESGGRVSQYQPTDGTLSYVEDYGAWFNKGGIGGTIQNPLLRLNEDGSISSRDGSFVINQDGTGHFASGRFRWSKDTITLVDVTIRWEDLSEDAKENLKGEPGKDGKDGEDAYSLIVTSSNGQIFRGAEYSSVLTAQLFKGSMDITVLIADDRFVWTRASSDAGADEHWNNCRHCGKSITITQQDIDDKAVFYCDVIIPNDLDTNISAIIELKYPVSEITIDGNYILSGIINAVNVTAITIIDVTDIRNIFTFDPANFIPADLSQFENKDVLAYIVETLAGESASALLTLTEQ